MKTTPLFSRFSGVIVIALALVLSLAEPIDAFAGKSFGGSRGSRSFGGSRRSYSAPSRPPSSFGGSRSTSPSYSPQRSPSMSPSSSMPRRSTSFGGTRLQSRDQYTRSYGTPRRSEQRMTGNADGSQTRTIVHSYGGRGDGFMMGYMMGSVPFMWHTPFHPAFYYSRPHYYHNPDGSVEVYPGTFSFGSLLMVIIIGGAVIFIIYRVVRSIRRKALTESASSFS